MKQEQQEKKQRRIEKQCVFVLIAAAFCIFSLTMVYTLTAALSVSSQVLEENQVQFRNTMTATGGPSVYTSAPSGNFKFNNFKLLETEVGDRGYLEVTFDLVYDDPFPMNKMIMVVRNLKTDIVYEVQAPFYYYGSTSNRISFYLKNQPIYSTNGEYEIEGITFYSDNRYGLIHTYNLRNSDYMYSSATYNSYKYDFGGQRFKITASENDPILNGYSEIYDCTLVGNEGQKNVVVGGKYYFKTKYLDKNDEAFDYTKDIKSMLLTFKNTTDGSMFSTYAKDISRFSSVDSYILIPNSVKAGKYELQYGFITKYNGNSSVYKNTDKLTFAKNMTFEVKEKNADKSKYIVNNEEINDKVYDDFEELNNDAVIIVDATNKSIIDQKMFETISDTSKTLIIQHYSNEWVFNGKDIKNPKTIDVSTLVDQLKTSEYYNDFLENNVTSSAAILNFEDNGDLPGKVLIRVSASQLYNIINNTKLYVYYYKEDADKLMKVAMEVQENSGFYEFYINHNSKYIITDKEIISDAVSSSTEMLELNTTIIKENNTTLLFIISGVCGLIIFTLIATIISMASKNKKEKKEEKEEKNKDKE